MRLKNQETDSPRNNVDHQNKLNTTMKPKNISLKLIFLGFINNNTQIKLVWIQLVMKHYWTQEECSQQPAEVVHHIVICKKWANRFDQMEDRDKMEWGRIKAKETFHLILSDKLWHPRIIYNHKWTNIWIPVKLSNNNSSNNSNNNNNNNSNY